MRDRLSRRRLCGLYALVIAASFEGNVLLAQTEHGRPLERSWERGPLRLTLRVSNESPFVSDELAVQLQVKASEDMDIELPKLAGLPKEWQISGVRTIGPTSGPDGDQVWSLSFQFELLSAGIAELPALTVRYRASHDSNWSQAETEPVSIEFRSMLGDDPDAAQPRPNPEPVPWPARRLFWVVFASACVAILLATLGGWLVWRRRPPSAARLAIFSPFRKALEALLRIEAAGYLERGEIERFYTELSSVIRHYIEERFGLRAPEQTTEEFLQELTQRPVLEEVQRRALETFLEQCDLVKFAKVRPTSSEGTAALTAARTFVEATRDDWKATEP